MNGFDPAVDAFSAAAGNRSGSGAFDLSEVDFEFVERCTKKDARKLANIVRALESDGGYPQLLSAARNKLASIDPTRYRHTHSRREQRAADVRTHALTNPCVLARVVQCPAGVCSRLPRRAA